MAFPGEEQSIVTVPHYTGTKAHLNAGGPHGSPGLYTAGFVLTKPSSRNSPENEIRFADDLRGDSHLAIASPAIVIDINPDHIQMVYRSSVSNFSFHGYPNEAGYLAKLVSEPFFAQNRDHAHKTAATAMRALLSNLSSQLDIPLIVEVEEINEIATKSRGISFVTPFASVAMSVQAAGRIDDPENEHAVALYREALNSNTPIYRFLCFFKILELSRKRRERLGRNQKSAMKQLRVGEQIPLGDRKSQLTWLNALFHANRYWDDGILDQIFLDEALGKKINTIFDQQLTPIRHMIAHGLLDSGNFLLIDRAEDRARVMRWLPLLRCLARRVMKNDFADYLQYLNEDGTISG